LVKLIWRKAAESVVSSLTRSERILGSVGRSRPTLAARPVILADRIVGIYGKNDKDSGDQAKNNANTQKVFDACFK
jgi:hypothetical protein